MKKLSPFTVLKALSPNPQRSHPHQRQFIRVW